MSALQTGFAHTTGTTTELTVAYVQKVERQKYRAVALLLFLVVISFIWLLFQFDNDPGQDGPALFSNFMYTLTSLIGAGWTFHAAYQGSRGPVVLGKRHRQAWVLIGLGLLANGLGNVYYGYYQYVFKIETPIPSYADIGFTVFYVLTLTGLLLLPVHARCERLGIHVVIDSLITVLCLLGISWYIVISHSILNAQPDQFLTTLVSISYPFWDVLLLLALILFVHQRAAPVMRSSLIICSLGVLAQVWADSAYSYLTSYNHYHSGMAAIDPFWFLGYLLIGIAPLYQYSAIVRQAYANQAQLARRAKKTTLNTNAERNFVLAQSLMIYLPTTILLALTLYCQFLANRDRELTLSLDVLSVVVLFLVTTHYVLATYENARLVREKEQSRADAELLRKSTASLSSVLEMDLLLSHIVAIGATELGFDASALVLIEEYDRALDEQSSLLARAATSDIASALSWRVTGQYIPFCLALMGKEIEVLWSEAPAHVPTLVHQWHMDQHIEASLFVPLAYQGRIQGSLALSLRNARRFTERECYLAKAFAEEAANAIEHAHLYELARENALFAEAMSNVAARLNSVVATGMGLDSEIPHLICTEAANALSADLAILYVQQPGGQFVPHAALSSDPDAPTISQEWAPLSPDDYYALLLNSSLPTLLPVNQLLSHRRTTERGDGMAAFRQGTTGQQIAQYSPAPAYPSLSPTTSLRPARASLVSLREYGQPHLLHLITLQEALKRRYALTAILAPLIIHQTPVGLLVLARTHKPGIQGKRAFAATDLESARDFTGQAAIAFTNARLYQQLHNAHRRMQELDQLKDQFMVTASHELRTPLTAVQGYLELLENYHTTLAPEQLEEFLDKASRGCEELVLLLNNVMDASRLEIEAGIRPASLERVAVREVIEHVVDLILLQATQEHRDIQVSVPSQLAVRADPTRLRQVIRNLSVNALKYSPAGTPVLFSARAVFQQSPSVILSVSDYGKGIAPQDQGKLFQRFVRLESDLNSTVRGSGLGLYISRRLVEAMNGKIWIESTGKPGEGSTFCIQLPMA